MPYCAGAAGFGFFCAAAAGAGLVASAEDVGV